MNLGDRMKLYEAAETERRVLPLVPTLARLDGRAFHTFCRGMAKPYDERMIESMIETARGLLDETDALIAYTQSDEITLIWHQTDIKSQIFMDGRIFKMQSILAGLAAAYFNDSARMHLEECWHRRPVFDCRVWSVPNREEACNALLWRERDATRNSILAAAQAQFSHKQLFEKNGDQMQEMLMGVGINWNDYPASFKRGTYIRRVKVARPFADYEIARLSPKHEAHTNPNLIVERHVVQVMDMPPFGSLANPVAVVFEGAEPECR